jgi:hydrogenase maturation protease
MKTLVVGLGNSILCDDGVGIRVACEIATRIPTPDVDVIDTSTAGLDFIDMLADYDRAIIIDAINTHSGKPGEIYRLGTGVLNDTMHATSPHDINFASALELGKQLGLKMPSEIVVYAIEVADVITFSEICTPAVERAIPECVGRVLKDLGN